MFQLGIHLLASIHWNEVLLCDVVHWGSYKFINRGIGITQMIWGTSWWNKCNRGRKLGKKHWETSRALREILTNGTMVCGGVCWHITPKKWNRCGYTPPTKDLPSWRTSIVWIHMDSLKRRQWTNPQIHKEGFPPAISNSQRNTDLYRWWWWWWGGGGRWRWRWPWCWRW